MKTCLLPQIFTCSTSKIEALEKVWNMFKVKNTGTRTTTLMPSYYLYFYLWTYFKTFSRAFLNLNRNQPIWGLSCCNVLQYVSSQSFRYIPSVLFFAVENISLRLKVIVWKSLPYFTRHFKTNVFLMEKLDHRSTTAKN